LHERFVLITGCSGGGKSTLLSELHARGHKVVEEPGRQIVKDQLQTGGRALPWVNALAFTQLAISTALADREMAKSASGWVFFDRGLIDAGSALQHLTGQPVLGQLNELHPYHRLVFMTPPWPEIYVTDAERRLGFRAGIEEYERLRQELPALGYDVVLLPKVTPSARAEFVLNALESSDRGADLRAVDCQSGAERKTHRTVAKSTKS
jgi:predicted ATPase